MNTPAPQPLVDLHGLLSGIRRRRRLWLSLALLGLIVGAALAVVIPSPPSASARILVVHEQDTPSDPGTLIKTDIAVLQTTRVAGAALKSLGIAERPEDFLKNYSAVAVSNNVLDLTVKGTSEADAVARAKAVADAFISDYVHRIQDAAASQQQALTRQRDQARTELSQVDTQISQLSGKYANASATQLESLYSQRADLASRISNLTAEAEQAGIGAPKVTSGTQIMDAARPVARQMLKTGATNAGLGLAIGLVLGIALAAVAGVVRDRPVLRRDVAEHLGASVIAQLKSRSEKERERVAATTARLMENGRVSLLELGCPKLAAELAKDIAGKLGTEADTIGVGSVSPGAPWTDLPRLGRETVLVVRAGHANTEWLHTIARQLADCRIPVLGVVLVDPDPRDRTDGTLWDGLHTALRGRERKRFVRPEEAPTKVFAQVKNSEEPTKILAPVKPVKDVEVS
ncbi:Wzz/FepE/Etk N-terminal domain-containing protein [Amycolatopsis pigmentata]|uniref:Wzz/FepE/Etk N-terminal domain-containing protein n=1 Tax=Amycolatopsis pigmentata TaxID=450801 RepID=A0ABW5FVH9_9PSEU